MIIVWVMIELSNATKKNGFKKLNIKREAASHRILEEAYHFQL
jgi:hypothetical protein